MESSQDLDLFLERGVDNGFKAMDYSLSAPFLSLYCYSDCDSLSHYVDTLERNY